MGYTSDRFDYGGIVILKKIDNKCVENVSRILAELLTGYKITIMFKNLGLKDFDQERAYKFSKDYPNSNFPNSTKWKRIYESVIHECKLTGKAKALFQTIQYVMSPENFLDDSNSWENNKFQINKALIFYGFALNDSGKVQPIEAPKTFRDAQNLLTTLNDKLSKLDIHPEVIKFCKIELMTDNYFHAVLEASKGVLDRIRTVSGITEDGNRLIDIVFNEKNPCLIISNNKLESETEKSRYRGFKSLLKTIVYLYRNPNAHDPKLYDVTNETDVITAFTLMSLAHKILDSCIRVKM